MSSLYRISQQLFFSTASQHLMKVFFPSSCLKCYCFGLCVADKLLVIPLETYLLVSVTETYNDAVLSLNVVSFLLPERFSLSSNLRDVNKLSKDTIIPPLFFPLYTCYEYNISLDLLFVPLTLSHWLDCSISQLFYTLSSIESKTLNLSKSMDY